MPFVSRLLAVSALALLALPAARSSVAQDAKSFYTGKTLKIIVGLPPGGGADAYARLVQRHLGRHVPGAPYLLAALLMITAAALGGWVTRPDRDAR